MRPIHYSLDAGDDGDVIPVDQYLAPTNISLRTVRTGGITYSVAYTFDDIFAEDFVPASADWTDVTGMSALVNTNAEASVTSPVSALRITSSAGAGSVVLTVLQAGAIS